MTRLTSRAKGNEYSPKAYSINIPNKIRVRSGPVHLPIIDDVAEAVAIADGESFK
jgi:hypothetical protein